MKAWVTPFTGEYFETQDNVNISRSNGIPVEPLPNGDTEKEIKLQQVINEVIRKLGLEQMGG